MSFKVYSGERRVYFLVDRSSALPGSPGRSLSFSAAGRSVRPSSMFEIVQRGAEIGEDMLFGDIEFPVQLFQRFLPEDDRQVAAQHAERV